MEEQNLTTEKKKKSVTSKKPKLTKELFTVSILRPIKILIGNWKFQAMNSGEIMVKFCFAKRRLVWEVVINGFIEKIEIAWSNIIGIKASLNENEPGILELELSQRPKFYRRPANANPREHFQWDEGLDFTVGQQASKCRRHLVIFPPGMLDQHLLRLINGAYRLFELIQQPFPTNNNPYFFSQTEAEAALPSFQPNFNDQTLQLPQAALNFIDLQIPVDDFPQSSNMLAPENVINPQPSSSLDIGYDIGCSNGSNMSMMNNMEALEITSNNTISNQGQVDFNHGVYSQSNNDIPNWAMLSTFGMDSNINCVSDGYSMTNNNIDEPTCSNGVLSSEYLLNNVNIENSGSTHLQGLTSSFFSEWETDSNGVWKPFRHELMKNTKGSKNCSQSDTIK